MQGTDSFLCRIAVSLFGISAVLAPAAAEDDRAIGRLTRLSPELSRQGLSEDMGRCTTGIGCRSALPNSGSSAAPLAVAVRSYYADLSFDASPERDQQAVMGNCLNQRLKIVVSDSFEVSWEIKEATRVSRWKGLVDPASGALSVKPNGVELTSRTEGDAGNTFPSEAIGEFAKSRITYGPCGTGQIVVRN